MTFTKKIDSQVEKMKGLMEDLYGKKYSIEGSIYKGYAKKFEKRYEKYGVKAYGIKVEDHIYGKVVNLLYVEGDESLWAEQERSLKNGVPDCYGFNLEHSCCSEFGSVELSK